MNLNPWIARFVEDFPNDGHRLQLVQRLSNGNRAYVSASLLLTEEPAGVVSGSPEWGILFPHDAYEAIVQAIDPAPHGVEVRRLEEALAVERRRVDDILRGVR